MTEPNRDATNPPLNPSPVAKPWTLSPLNPRPGIFTRDAKIPRTLPGASFVEALRSLVGPALGEDWHATWQAEDSVRIWRGHPGPLSFEVAIHRPTDRDGDYVTSVDHEVTDPQIAAPLEHILREHRKTVSGLTALLVGHVRKEVPGNPFQPALLHVGIGNRWPVPPSSAEENRIAEFVIWNIQVLLWLRAEAERYGGGGTGAQLNSGTAERLLGGSGEPKASSLKPKEEAGAGRKLERGWEAILWPKGWDPFGALVPWVGLSSPAVFQPLAFDAGYWFEQWTEQSGARGGMHGLIETARRALPSHLGPDWYVDSRSQTHAFLRHEKHPWIFEIRERKTICTERRQHPVPFSIRTPGGPFCPTGTAASVRVICPSQQQAEGVAREVCDRRSGTCDATASFYPDSAEGSVKWGVRADLSGSGGVAPAFPWRHARPGLDASGWWAEGSWQRHALLKLQVIWALKILHAACLRHERANGKEMWGG